MDKQKDNQYRYAHQQRSRRGVAPLGGSLAHPQAPLALPGKLFPCSKCKMASRKLFKRSLRLRKTHPLLYKTLLTSPVDDKCFYRLTDQSLESFRGEKTKRRSQKQDILRPLGRPEKQKYQGDSQPYGEYSFLFQREAKSKERKNRDPYIR